MGEVQGIEHTGQRRCAYGILVGKTEGKKPLG